MLEVPVEPVPDCTPQSVEPQWLEQGSYLPRRPVALETGPRADGSSPLLKKGRKMTQEFLFLPCVSDRCSL